MKRLLAILTALFLLSGTASASECMGTDCFPKEVKQACTVKTSEGCIDWTNGIIYATGMGVPNPKFPTKAQQRYSAMQAAKTVAMRNLLQMVENVYIDSTTTVKAGMLESDEIKTQVSGTVRQVEQFGKARTMSDGSVWVTMRMHLRDLYGIMVQNENMPTASGHTDAKEKNEAVKAPAKAKTGIQYGGMTSKVYTGVIINASGRGIVPAMSPKVYGKNGKEVYGSANVEREFVLEHGIVGYTKNVKKAQTNDRIGSNPLFIKGTKKGSSDVVISNKDAKLLDELFKTQSFLREARVMIVL